MSKNEPEYTWNVDAIDSGIQAVASCRKELLEYLKYLLDSYHGWSKPIDYYEVLAGGWLESLSHVTYAAMVETRRQNVSHGLTPIPVSSDFDHHVKLVRNDDSFHRHLRSSIESLFEGGTPEKWLFGGEFACIESGGREEFHQRVFRFIATAKPEALIVAPYFKCSRMESASMLLRGKSWMALDNLRYPVHVSARLDTKWRKQRSMDSGQPVDLSGLLKILLPLHLPVALLEGFADYRNVVLGLPIHRPRVVYSATALHNNLPFKLLAAEWREAGSRLLYHQHGGCYGTDRVHTLENYEIRASDRYYTWGWEKKDHKVEYLSPAPVALSSRKKGGHILLACGNFPRLMYRLQFSPRYGTIQTMHQETCKFLEGMRGRNRLLIRPYQHDFGWNAEDMMRKAAPEAKFDDWNTVSSVRFAQSSLVVFNYISTGYLETLYLNIPTIVFYDPNAYAFRAEAQPFMDTLEHVGILHRSGTSAAKFVTGLGNDIEGWWMRAEVQEARHRYVAQYANFSPDWKREWERAFRSEIALAS